MPTGYYLLDNKNPNGPHYYTSRRSPLLHIVLHITAGLEDLDGVNDQSAERTARYATTTTRPVSWHAGADADSFLYLLPANYTAFHCKGFNSSGYGLEISKRTARWAGMPADWVEKTLRNAAKALAPIVRKYGIPLRRLTKAQALAGEKGFLYHADADPTRRVDPGADFPLSRLFALIRAELGMPTATTAPLLEDDTDMKLIRNSTEGSPLFGAIALLNGPNAPFEHIQNPEVAGALSAALGGVKDVNAREFDLIAAHFSA